MWEEWNWKEKFFKKNIKKSDIICEKDTKNELIKNLIIIINN